MSFIFGMICGAAIVTGLYGVYKAGQRSRKVAPKEIDEQQAERAKRLRQGFNDLMSYDVSKATGRKGVG